MAHSGNVSRKNDVVGDLRPDAQPLNGRGDQAEAEQILGKCQRAGNGIEARRIPPASPCRAPRARSTRESRCSAQDRPGRSVAR